MEELLFYISAIDANLLNTIGGQPGELIQMVRNNPDLNEEEVASKLFQGKFSKQYFLNAKVRTLKILRSFLIVSPPKNSSDLQKKSWTARRKYMTAMVFIESHRREIANKLLRQAFNTSLEYGFTRIAYDCATELLIAASLDRKRERFEYYQGKSQSLLADLNAEQMVKDKFHRVQLEMNSKMGIVKPPVREDMLLLEEQKCRSPIFLQYYFSLRTIMEINAGQYPLLKQTTDAAIQQLSKKKGVYRSFLQLFYKGQAIAEIALKNFERAKLRLIEAEAFAPTNSYNLGILKFYQAINALHAGDYALAYEGYRENRKSRFDTLNEQWLIMGAYLYFLKSMDMVETGSDRFSVGKYLNETSPNAHDKRGSNVNILIGELLMNLVKNRSRFISRVEAINNYSYKYLKGHDTQRAKWFIRLLCLFPRANFHPEAIERIGSNYIKKLESHPVALGDNLAVEMIPFQTLWSIIKNHLSTKIRRRRQNTSQQR